MVGRMIAAFARALAQLREPAFRNLLLLSIAIAVASFAVLLGGLWLALPWLEAQLPASAPGWVRTAVGVVTGVGAVLLSMILFPGVVTAVQSALFVDRICAAVEQRHYPALPPPRAPGVFEQARTSLRFLGLIVGLNLVALPFYFVPGLNAVVFIALNGYLLAREHFDSVAPRRLDAAQAREMWRRRRLRFWVAGAVFALLMTIPFVNLAGAIVAAATMTHLVESARRERDAS
jgi:CysZ protein